ncbi:MAG: hypothetical protein IT558_01930 [Alphaproteobacteria bacterium]|nr:hypothetical protein [Alphaproteobacteria bacterium]
MFKKIKPGKSKERKAIEDVKAFEDPLTDADRQIDAAVARSSIKERRDRRRKLRIKIGLGTAGFCLLAYGIYLLLVPFQGSMAFGLCKVFLEMNVRFPQTLRLSTVEEFDTSVRIWYTQVDSFGEYRMEPIQCYFKEDPQFGYIMDKVTVNRRAVDGKTVEKFNKILPVIFAVPPDLSLPSELPDSLQDLIIETDRFRRKIL